MEFFKKNWSKITIATISAVLAILMLVLLVSMESYTFMAFCELFGMFIFFLGLTVYIVLKLVPRTEAYSKYAMFAAAMISTIFLAMVWIDSINNYGDVADYSKWYANKTVFTATAYLCVFGLIPFIRGSQKILSFFAKQEAEERARIEAERLAAEEKARLEAEAAATKKRKPRTPKPKAEPVQEPEQHQQQEHQEQNNNHEHHGN